MKFLRRIVFTLILTINSTLIAQSQRELGQLMQERGEYYFTLKIEKTSDIQSICEICSIDGTDGKIVVAYANQKEYDMLLKAGYQPELQTPPSMKANVTMWDGQGTYNWDSYLTYTQYVNMMEDFPSKTIGGRSCTLIDLGELSTSAHRHLLGVRINNGQPNGKPKFLYTSTMHGDEITGMILMLRLINELCTSTNSRIANLVSNLDIYIFPLTNPDGTYYGGNNTVNNARRYNGHNVDLNRNYRDYYMGDHPDGNSYEDETVWTMAFGDENLFTMSANYHGGAEVMNYPWDAVYDDHADKDWYEHVCTEYVQLARQTYSSYMSDTYSDGVTSGAAWYVITGSRQDYMNAYAQCREVTIECSSTKTPAASQLPNFWNYNHNSMLAFMEQALNGVHGFVYDANTGQPIEGAKVTVESHDNGTSFVTTHNVGDFHRPIKGGTYTLEITKDGYCPYFVDVTVADDQRVELNNIQLTPGNCMVPSFTASATNVALGQSISFTDASFGTIASWLWNFEGATPSTSTAQNPTGITYNMPGDYDVTLTITDADGNSEILTKENYIHVMESMLIGDGGSSTHNYLPSYNYYNYSLTEQIYTSDEFGEEGTITGIAFFNEGAVKTRNYDLYLTTTTKSSFTSKTDWITVNDSDKVFSGSVTMAANEWTIFTFSTPFVYDGSSNVVLVVDDNTGVWTNSPHMACRVFNATNQALYIYEDYTDFDPSSPPTSSSSYNDVLSVKNQILVFKETPHSYVITATANPATYGGVTFGTTFDEGNELVFDFEDNTTQGWTLLQGPNSDSPDNWMHSSQYTHESYSGKGHNNSWGFMLSESYISNTSNSVHPDNYLVSPQIMLGGSIHFWATNLDNEYGAEHFAVAVSTNGNTDTNDFTTVQEWTLLAAKTGNTRSIDDGTWYEYSVDLSTFTELGYVAIHHFDCYDQWLLCVDDITIVEGVDNSTCSAVFIQDESCTVTAAPRTGYRFVNWTENGNEVSSSATYTFSVNEDRDLVANFSNEAEQTVTLSSGWCWWSPNVNVTLDELKSAIADAIGSDGTATIRSKNNSVSYTNGRWRGSLNSIDITQMYKIQTSTSCEITLTGIPFNPAQQSITITKGANWIPFPLNESMSVNEAFQGFPENGDIIKSKDTSASFNGSSWRGTLRNLEPGNGYVYQSKAQGDKTLIFPTNK